MFWPASAEYVALCRSQAQLAVNHLGISSFGVYLTEESGDRRSWLPVLVYPEGDGLTHLAALPAPLQLPQAPEPEVRQNLALQGDLATHETDLSPLDWPGHSLNQEIDQSVLEGEFWTGSPRDSSHLIVPLLYESLPLGVLVVWRPVGTWQAWEETQLQQVAETLAIGCVMDQRHQWLLQSQSPTLTQQQDVLGNLLHQFRNPLMALQTLTKLLLKRLQPPDKNRPVVESIWHEGQRLQHLVEQFQATLDQVETIPPQLAPVASPSLSLAPASLNLLPTDVLDTIQPLLIAAQARAHDLGITLNVEPDPDLPPALVDTSALQEIVGNLLDNACKYTPAGGNIHLQMRLLTADTQGLLIVDTGLGISQGDLLHLGERGYRGQQAQGQIPGTGLGIAIAKNLVAQMGGSLTIQSPFPLDSDHGTAVLLALPNATKPHLSEY